VAALAVAASAARPFDDLLRGQHAISPPEAWQILEGGFLLVVEHTRGPETATLVAWSRARASRAEVLVAAELCVAVRRARGEALKVIAFDLGLSMASVTRRVSAAMRKLRLQSLAELVSLFCSWPDGVAARRFVGTTGEGLTLTYRSPSWPLPPCLTPAERGVVEGLVAGQSHAAIARKRRVSVHTIASQLATAYRKMGVRSQLELFVALHRLDRPGA
jgi:DNA-binding NarL/FixJ family response regulator